MAALYLIDLPLCAYVLTLCAYVLNFLNRLDLKIKQGERGFGSAQPPETGELKNE